MEALLCAVFRDLLSSVWNIFKLSAHIGGGPRSLKEARDLGEVLVSEGRWDTASPFPFNKYANLST